MLFSIFTWHLLLLNHLILEVKQTNIALIPICINSFTKTTLIKQKILNINYHKMSSLKKFLKNKNFFKFRSEQTISILLALIYPSLWIFYLFLPRFYRLDTTINLYTYINVIDQNIILIFICYMFLPLIVAYSYKMKLLRDFLWEYTAALSYRLHLSFLQYQIYFKFCEYFYKAFFIFHDIFGGNSGATWNHCKRWDSFIQNIFSFLYFRAGKIVFFCFVFFVILCEIILSHGKLHLSLYLLFFSPLILSFFYHFKTYGERNFVLDVCISDYKCQNFFKLKYPRKFWIFMQSLEKYFGFVYKVSPQCYKNMMETLALEMAKKKASDIFYSKEILDRSWGIRYIKTIYIKTNTSDYTIPGYYKYFGNIKPWSFRLAAKYKKYNGVRWFHSTPRLQYPLPENIHPKTLFFIGNNIYALLAICNHPSLDYNVLQQIAAKKKFPSPSKLYSAYDTDKILLPENDTNLVETLESNLVMRFKCLTKDNIIIGTYNKMKSLINYNKMEALQMRPDFVSNWTNSSYFLFKGILGIDQKHKNVTLHGRNQIITRPIEQYEDLLDEYRKKLEQKFPKIGIDVLIVLQELKNSKNDPEKHIQIWAESLHLFPENFKPPILLDKTFDDSNLTEHVIKLLKEGEAFIEHVSDCLFVLEKTEEGQGSIDDLAFDYFDDSFIKKQMNCEEEPCDILKTYDPLEVD